MPVSLRLLRGLTLASILAAGSAAGRPSAFCHMVLGGGNKPSPSPFSAFTSLLNKPAKPAAVAPPKVVNAPRPFFVRPDRALDVLTAALPSVLRGGQGAFVLGYQVKFVEEDQVNPAEYSFIGSNGKRSVETSAKFVKRPVKPLRLYEFQGCPFCAKVREAVTILDLDVLFQPTPQGSTSFRPEAIAKGGKSQFPYLVDENTGVAMYESDDIIAYLFQTYGDGSGQVPKTLKPGFATTLSFGLSLASRIGKGSRASAQSAPGSRKALKPIEFWGYEASPFSRIVKETLCGLELQHVQRSCARGSSKRSILKQRTGAFLVPYIEDPNTGVAMFESAEIVDYLKKTYGSN